MKGENAAVRAGNGPAVVVGADAPGRRSALRVALAGILLALLAFLGGFVAFASHIGALSTPTAMRQADAIIVLTGGLYRLDAGVDLLRSGKGKRLLISGVNPMANHDDLSAATGGDTGLFSCCVDIDHAALDTIGNAHESAKWLEENDYSSVIVVTNNYHMPRSLLEMRRLMREAVLQPYPVVNTPLDNGRWLTNRDALRVLFMEYAKYVAALARGLMPAATAPGEAETVSARAGKE